MLLEVKLKDNGQMAATLALAPYEQTVASDQSALDNLFNQLIDAGLIPEDLDQDAIENDLAFEQELRLVA
jgi:hypothetical protein